MAGRRRSGVPEDCREQAEGADVDCGAPQADRVDPEQLGPDEVDHHGDTQAGTGHAYRVQGPATPGRWRDDECHDGEVGEAEDGDRDAGEPATSCWW
jgi:hypothetical protein